MTAITIDHASARRHVTDPLQDLLSAHLEAAATVAELDLDDAGLWREVEGIVIEITAAAYAVTSQVTGTPPDVTANRVPPIVRVRELATAQRRLFAALDRWPALVSRVRGPLTVARGPLDAWQGRREPRVLEVRGRPRTQPGASGTGPTQRDFGHGTLDQQLVEQASLRVRGLGQQLPCVALSGITIGGDRRGD